MSGNAFDRLKSYAEDIFHDRSRLIRILLIILILMLALVMRIHENSKADITVESTAGDTSGGQICVDIGGAVVNPGVYTVDTHTRLYEVIELAGGLVSNADTELINRAEYVEDGEKIIIPSRPYAPSETGSTASETEQQDTGEAASSSAPSEDTESAADTADTAAYSSSALVNINYASKEELMTLSGIGEAKAERIIEYRSSRKFRKKEDIKSVKGIGDAIYDKIKDDITV